jgi:hypothetical protein
MMENARIGRPLQHAINIAASKPDADHAIELSESKSLV